MSGSALHCMEMGAWEAALLTCLLAAYRRCCHTEAHSAIKRLEVQSPRYSFSSCTCYLRFDSILLYVWCYRTFPYWLPNKKIFSLFACKQKDVSLFGFSVSCSVPRVGGYPKYISASPPFPLSLHPSVVGGSNRLWGEAYLPEGIKRKMNKFRDPLPQHLNEMSILFQDLVQLEACQLLDDIWVIALGHFYGFHRHLALLCISQAFGTSMHFRGIWHSHHLIIVPCPWRYFTFLFKSSQI